MTYPGIPTASNLCASRSENAIKAEGAVAVSPGVPSALWNRNRPRKKRIAEKFGNIRFCHRAVSVRANTKATPADFSRISFSKNGTASRPYGGFNQTRWPVQSTAWPSKGRQIIRAAVRHGMVGGQHGSMSNGPSASMMCGGVSHVFSPVSTFMFTESAVTARPSAFSTPGSGCNVRKTR